MLDLKTQAGRDIPGLPVTLATKSPGCLIEHTHDIVVPGRRCLDGSHLSIRSRIKWSKDRQRSCMIGTNEKILDGG